MPMIATGVLTLSLVLLAQAGPLQAQLWDEVERGYAQNGDVQIHYAAVGEGPLVVMIHGFPDFWYSWRHQMEGLKDDFRVVAIDQRGYNRSGQPEGIESYDMSLLVEDVAAVVQHLGYDQATIVGHDWGGVVAWNVAFRRPEIVHNLVVMDLPHPTSMGDERRGLRQHDLRQGLPRGEPGRSGSLLWDAHDATDAVRVGSGSRRSGKVRRGLLAIGLRRDAGLLQAELPRPLE